MAVEFAVALPGVLACIALCLGAVQTAGHQLRLVDKAAMTARMLARGDPAPAGAAGAVRSVERLDGLVCVELASPSPISGVGALGLTVSARECALDESTVTG